jgi:GT2 family glycosyltransferase
MRTSVSLLAVRYETPWANVRLLIDSFEFSANRAGFEPDAVIWNNGEGLDSGDDSGQLRVTVLSSGANELHSLGINRAALAARGDYLVIASPDMILGRETVGRLIEPMVAGDAEMVEGRQIPFDHPKDFDQHSGRTSWASGALFAMSRELFTSLGGFDADALPMYCNDTDLSWRVRARGGRIMHRASAFGWHSKNPGPDGYIRQSDYESRHALIGFLRLAHKWRRMDVVAQARRATRYAGTEDVQRQWREYEEGVARGVPQLVDEADSRVADFRGLNIGRNRF